MENDLDIEDLSIPEFFRGRNIFITGGTGFMGKVLIEKLLRSCPGIENIFMLVRPKKGKTPSERIKTITDLPLFDLLKQEHPNAIYKIKPILGDVTELNLGLSEEDRNLLIHEVSIVYHSAASVRFDDPLKDAIIMNTRGTQEVIKLAKQMSKLQVMVHISTTFCNTDKKIIREEVYPCHASWKDSIKLAENANSYMLDILTAKYISPLPNTYTFTKSLAEHVVKDECTGQIPAVIFRPSIVISSLKDPIPGWIDNFNGPVGILAASGKGVLRTLYTDPNMVADYVPVDLVIRAIIIVSWKKGITNINKKKLDVAVYNCSNNHVRPVTMRELVQLGKLLCPEIAVNNILWYPNTEVTSCWYLHFFRMVFYQLLPALVIDSLLKLSGRKPILIKIHRRIYIANMALEFFITNQWTFINENILELEKSVKESDREDFWFDRSSIDVFDYFRKGMLGGRQYLMKEDPSTLESAVKNSHRMWLLSQVFNSFWYLGVLWLIFFKLSILDWILNIYNDTYFYLMSD